MSKASERMRREWKENDAKRDAGLKTPETVRRFDDLIYGTNEAIHRLDCFRPKSSGMKKLPTIVVVHGGGWVYGDKELYQHYACTLAERGFAVICYTYSLAPEFHFPASFVDTNNVIKWMYEHADEYGLDMDNVCLAGDSAGAHMTGIYTAMCTDEKFASEIGITIPYHFKPKAIFMNCGAYTLKDDKEKDPNKEPDDGDHNDELMEDLMGHPATDEELGMLDVLKHINASFPPAFIMSAYGDFLLDQQPMLVKEYEKNHIFYESRIYGSESEPLYHVFHLNMRLPIGQKCNDEECDFFRKIVDL